MLHSLSHLLSALALLTAVLAQSIGFTVYPQQVITGLTYTLAWNSNGQPATIELLRNGAREDAIFTSDGTTNTYQWSVQDDYSAGTNYALMISAGGSTAVVDNIYVIEDEDGLVVSGSTIRTPSPTATINLAQASTMSSAASASSSATPANPASTGALGTGSTTSAPSATSTDYNRVTLGRGLSGAAIAGIVIGILGAAIVAGAGVWLCMRKKRASVAKLEGEQTFQESPTESFLALGKTGYVSGTIKGTSPEVSDYPKNQHELEAGGIVSNPELYGESYTPWNERDRRRFYSDTASSGETAVETTRHELAADDVRT